MIIIFGTRVKNEDISSKSFHFFKSGVLRLLGGKTANNDLTLLITVYFALHLRNCR